MLNTLISSEPCTAQRLATNELHCFNSFRRQPWTSVSQ